MRSEFRQSDSGVVPAKSLNKPGKETGAEEMEGRPLAKGKRLQSPMPRTQGRMTGMSEALERLRDAARPAANRHDLRQEPDAVTPLVRICAGGGQQWPSLPRPTPNPSDSAP